MQFLARRDRTELQVKEFLTRKGASPHDIVEILTRARAQGYLDDVAFAFRWGTARLDRQPMGMKRLEEELRAQGIDRLAAKDAVERIFQGRTELELAQKLLVRRSPRGRRGDASKHLGLLRRQGFSEETIEYSVTRLRDT